MITALLKTELKKINVEVIGFQHDGPTLFANKHFNCWFKNVMELFLWKDIIWPPRSCYLSSETIHNNFLMLFDEKFCFFEIYINPLIQQTLSFVQYDINNTILKQALLPVYSCYFLEYWWLEITRYLLPSIKTM